MKANFHPKYYKCEVTCVCGASFTTRSTVPQIKVEICSQCHPYFTGTQKIVDTAGRVEKFRKKYGKKSENQEVTA
jgi:large subunit ribosomal protein L31